MTDFYKEAGGREEAYVLETRFYLFVAVAVTS
jgi:hypothetical protein